jgi:S-adenosylmethionine:tRNA-ribosyltransferase-isomerase (queuine synthetase)
MSIELRDGSFTPIEPFSDSLMAKFKDFAETGQAVALHVGTEAFLQDRINKKSLEEQVQELREKVEAQIPAQSTVLHIPNMDEIKKIIGT